MRIILDECLPKRLGQLLSGHIVTTVPQAGWAGTKNGALLKLIGGAYDAFITMDKNLPAQQTAPGSTFEIVVIRCKSNRIDDLKALAPAILKALETLQPAHIAIVP